MRISNRTFLVALMLICSGLSFAIPLRAQKAADRASMAFASPLIDLGTLCIDSVASYHFEFRNSGNSMLVITDAQPSCPCMELNWQKGPIQAGERGWLDIRFHADVPGPFDKAVWITSNSTDSTGQMQPVELRVRGLVMSRKMKH